MFNEVLFPVGISYGSSGGPGFSTNIIETDSGQEERIPRWEFTKHTFNAAEGVKSYDDLAELKAFYLARQGVTFGFRYRDFLDRSSHPTRPQDESLNGGTISDTDQNLGTGDGTTVNFRLVKRYTSGSQFHDRIIEKPVAGTILIAINGTPQVEGVDFSVDTTTGFISFTVAPTGGQVLTWGGLFDVPCRFASDLDELFDMSIDDFGSGSTNVPIEEIRLEVSILQEMFFGGGQEYTINANHFVTQSGGHFQRLDVQTAALKAFLPDETNLSTGHLFVLENDGSESIEVVDDDDTDFTDALAAGVTKDYYLIVDQGGTNKVWVSI